MAETCLGPPVKREIKQRTFERPLKMEKIRKKGVIEARERHSYKLE